MAVIRFTVEPWNLPLGHRPRDTGCGVIDNRPRRRRTRGANLRAILRDQL